ncbi:M14 family metallopeptidase [Roseivirga sp. BDSF3-8]|uniref:M14 family metallopeptidase n=1 Tax=Roseivirga sp. BDSF3-8 TaxID=3241598 RepID=UPI0035320DFA
MRFFYITVFTLLFFLQPMFTGAQEIDLSYYLPDDTEYDESIPTPKEVLGYEVGEWHVRHDQLVQYMYRLAEASDRVSIIEYARSYEKRPLVMLAITSPDNQGNLEQMRQTHMNWVSPGESSPALEDTPLVLWMGYSVHGNEPSGSNASLLVAYHLAAGNSSFIDNLLSESVVLIDPSINPDGLNRFASWANTHKTYAGVTDPQSREFNEMWPRGRTNHYFFDLNRDWLPVQHPESQGRIRLFHEWKPNVLTDFHEMGSNSTYFFQPGIPSRTHPRTPNKNQELTGKLAEYHAEALDSIGSFYYSKESFDDFYYGKGSTYPDVNGGVGILFEQASSRGHAQENDFGIITFPFTIRNQFNTSLSTLRGSLAMKDELLSYQQSFYKDALQEGKRAGGYYVFGSDNDEAKAYHLADILRQHKIDIYRPASRVSANGNDFDPDDSYVVPMSQPQYKLIRAIFEKRTSFTDSLFYDVSAWTFPLAFNLPYAEVSQVSLGEKIEELNFPEGEIIGDADDAYSYLFEWDGYYAPRAAYRLMEEGLRLRVATSPVTLPSGKTLDRGTILVGLGTQEMGKEEVKGLVEKIAREDGIDVYAVSTGLTGGVNLGSPSFETLTQPKAAVLVEGGFSSYEAGEIWHLLDQRMDIPVSLLSADNIGRMDLSRYNTIIMPDMYYGGSESLKNQLAAWVRNGGTLVAIKGSARWLSQGDLLDISYKEGEPADSNEAVTYADMSNKMGAQVIGGAIFEGEIDLTHPIGYGYNRSRISLFRDHTDFMLKGDNPYATPIMYTANPLASGYISEENEEMLKNTAALIVKNAGRGKIIAFADNPNFRAFWYGTNKLFMNSLFFGPVINRRSSR